MSSKQPILAVPFSSIQLEDAFFAPRLRTLADVTLPVAIRHCESTPRMDNFINAAAKLRGEPYRPHEGIYFDDSDVYKVLEGIGYLLTVHPDPALEAKADEWIDAIAAAQEPDGYLDTYFTLNHPDQKWTDMEKHEDYCAGHLFEAAVAYWRATGKRKVLDVAIRLADCIYDALPAANRHWVVGHQEPELGLVKLYHATGNARHLELARWMIEERGHGHGRGMIWDNPEWGPRYCQDDLPVRELEKVTGHAVRAMYYYAGIADVAAETGDTSLEAPLHRLWAHTVNRNLYVTGGIGPSRHNEGFTTDYDLPNAEAYCETCASIGLLFWAHRMHRMTGRATYADIIEQTLFNNILAGISLAGDRFFYVNPLSSDGSHHRQAWFGCACCPSNVARLLPSLGGYLYTVGESAIHVNLYVGNTADILLPGKPESTDLRVRIEQKTDYPWEGKISLKVSPDKESTFRLRLRIPEWCRNWSLSVNGRPSCAAVSNGYAEVERLWQADDTVVLELDMPVEFIQAHPLVMADLGLVAVRRGPVVYCAEAVDNLAKPEMIKDSDRVDRKDHAEGSGHTGGPDNVAGLMSIRVDTSAPVQIIRMPDKLGGIVEIRIPEQDGKPAARLIPYYAWDNRGAAEMRVWLEHDAGGGESLYRTTGRPLLV
jgi:DUF1680 family protein